MVITKNTDKAGALALAKLITVEVERFNSAPRVHDGVTFVGYAYLTVRGKAGVPGLEHLSFSVRNVALKLWANDSVTLQFAEHKENDGQWRPSFFPRSAELRAVVTALTLRNPEIQKGIEAAAAARAAAAPEAEASAADAADEELEKELASIFG